MLISASGVSDRRARIPDSKRSMAVGENRLGVPPPMNTVETVRPQTSGKIRFKIFEQGIDVVDFWNLTLELVRIEITVRALFDTPGKMDVQAERWGCQ